jgi:hypothetical protein
MARDPPYHIHSISIPTDSPRFDLLRGYSGAEKLAFPSSVREFVASTGPSTLTSLVGCPVKVFTAIGEVLTSGKEHKAHKLSTEEFQVFLDDLMTRLQTWNPIQGNNYPNNDAEWGLLAEAYRHVAILRVLRFPDPYAIPCTDARVTASVSAILDVSAAIPRHSPYFKRLLFPLFVAGADTNSPHQQQYALMCIEHIKETTGISYRRSVVTMLEKTWEDRKKGNGERNVPWFDYVSVAGRMEGSEG